MFLIWDILWLIFEFASPRTKYQMTRTCRTFRNKIYGPESKFKNLHPLSGKAFHAFIIGDYLAANYFLWHTSDMDISLYKSHLNKVVRYHHRYLTKMMIIRISKIQPQEGKMLWNIISHSAEPMNYPISISLVKIAVLFRNYKAARKIYLLASLFLTDLRWFLLTSDSLPFIEFLASKSRNRKPPFY